jgi:CRISPR-associated protein Csy1
MAAELRDFMKPGWSAQADCQLNLAEQCWLDPNRALSDDDFAARYQRGDWKDEVCLRFANWLNASLKTDKTSFGGPEADEWQNMLREELEDE